MYERNAGRPGRAREGEPKTSLKIITVFSAHDFIFSARKKNNPREILHFIRCALDRCSVTCFALSVWSGINLFAVPFCYHGLKLYEYLCDSRVFRYDERWKRGDSEICDIFVAKFRIKSKWNVASCHRLSIWQSKRKEHTHGDFHHVSSWNYYRICHNLDIKCRSRPMRRGNKHKATIATRNLLLCFHSIEIFVFSAKIFGCRSNNKSLNLLSRTHSRTKYRKDFFFRGVFPFVFYSFEVCNTRQVIDSLRTYINLYECIWW